MEVKRKKCKVIMLPAKNSNIVKVYESNSIHLLTGKEDNTNMIYNLGRSKHLYITSDDEIKEGDWCYRTNKRYKDNKTSIFISKCYKQDNNLWVNFKDSDGIYSCLVDTNTIKKIIATTDRSLTKDSIIVGGKGASRTITYTYLPQPSKAFIEKYCKVGGIDEVMVEYEGCKFVCEKGKGTPDCVKIECQDLIPKINSHNEITIHPIKDSYTKEEVKKLLIDFAADGFCEDGKIKGKSPVETAKWINKNL